MKTIAVIAVAVLGVLIGSQLFPRTRTFTEIIQLPGRTDTLEVSKVDSVEVTKYRDRVVYSTDTLVLRDTVWRTAVDTLTALPFSWYLTRLQAGQSHTEPTYVSSLGLKYDGSLTAIQSLEQIPTTLGPVTDIEATPQGIRLNFGTWPEPEKTCQTWCVTKWVLGGVAGGIIIGSVF